MLTITLHQVRSRAMVWSRGCPRLTATSKPTSLCWALLSLGASAALAGEPEIPTDKSGYNLFKQTPSDLMRPLSTDRPDKTESPYTVDAGHLQLEMDFVNILLDHDRSRGGEVRKEAYAVAPLNLKLGLLNYMDVQFVFDTYVNLRVEDTGAGTVSRSTGFGDFQTRLKINIWGNDSGTTALGIMPFVSWPLPASDLRNGHTEGGLIIPLAVELPHGWGMGLMTEIDFIRNEANDGHDNEFINTIALGHDIVGPLAGYMEFFSAVSTASDADWVGQVAVGFTYGINENIQLDLGCNFGVTDAAPNYNPFAGLAWRF